MEWLPGARQLWTEPKCPSAHSSITAPSVPTRTYQLPLLCQGSAEDMGALRGKVMFQGPTANQGPGGCSQCRDDKLAPVGQIRLPPVLKTEFRGNAAPSTCVCRLCGCFHASMAVWPQQRPAEPELVPLQPFTADVRQPLVLSTADIPAFEEIQFASWFHGPDIPLVSTALNFLPLFFCTRSVTKEELFSCKQGWK